MQQHFQHHSLNNEMEFMIGTNHSKLVGTVYDFDEEMAGDSVENLKAMRDRRRSEDFRVDSYRQKDSQSNSPKFAVPSHGVKGMSYTPSELQVLRPPSPVGSGVGANAVRKDMSPAAATNSLHNIVPPVLPGPVDMRTYNASFEATNTENLLGAFASGTADQTLPEIDEEMEKELQSALKAGGTPKQELGATPTTTTTNAMDAVVDNNCVGGVPVISTNDAQAQPPTPEIDYMKTKFSFNQLKLKIKGPLVNSDLYSSSPVMAQQPSMSVPPVISAPMNPPTELNANLSQMAPNAESGNKLRRMRKKELLMEYRAQTDDHQVSAQAEQASTIFHPQNTQYNRGIPKAVDSLQLSKEEYKEYAAVDPKKRKRMPMGMTRELRQLELPSYDVDGMDAADETIKRRMRGGKDDPSFGMAPKLKIKFQAMMSQGEFAAAMSFDGTAGGDSTVESIPMAGCGPSGGSSSLPTGMSARPPKKRLSNAYVPSFEDLKRDSMNFRKLVMADFDDKKVKKEKKSKKVKVPKDGGAVATGDGVSSKKDEKRKKKKEKKREKLEVLNADPSAGSKLIIRIGKSRPEKKAEEPTTASTTAGTAVPTEATAESNNNNVGEAAVVENNDGSSVAVTAAAVSKGITPIRLKIARNSLGYVMAEKGEKNVATASPPGNGEGGNNGSAEATGSEKKGKSPSNGGGSGGKGGKLTESAGGPSAKEDAKKPTEGSGGGVEGGEVAANGCSALTTAKECEVR